MKWTAIAIVGFIVIYTAVMLVYRKEEAPHEPYEQARYRSGYDLRDAGWIPFPNAYSLAEDATELRRAPYQLSPIEREALAPDVAEWIHAVPDVQQGEQVAEIAGPSRIEPGEPYLARIRWEEPFDFQGPQLVFFRRDNEILIFTRTPPREADPSPESAFLIPPEFLHSGEYRIWLVTGDELSRWTFEVN